MDKLTNLGSRLEMAASFVNNGDTVCDVGCDHGKLGLYLIQSGKAKHIIATDINEKPLQKAIELFAAYNISDYADFYCTDGLQGVEFDNRVTHIVIAGVSGMNMTQIIDNSPFTKSKNLHWILLPAQGGHAIREYLYSSGYEILLEKTVSENHKYYTCMDVIYTGKNTDYDTYTAYIGKSDVNSDQSARGYFYMILQWLKGKLINSIYNGASDRQDIDTAIEKIEQLIYRIDKSDNS